MTQATPTIGANQSGLQYRGQDNDGKKALLTHHKGPAAPGYAEAGVIWLDDNTAPWRIKIHTGSAWVTIGTVNASNNAFMPYLGTGVLKFVNYAADTSEAANVYAVTPAPAIPALAAGVMVTLKPHADNTGACTLAVGDNGAVAIKLLSGANPHAGALKTSGMYTLIYDGAAFVLVNPSLGALAYKGKIIAADIDSEAAAAGYVYMADGAGGGTFGEISTGGLWEEIAYENVTGLGLSQLDMALPDGYDRYRLEIIEVYGSASAVATNMRLLYAGMASVYTSNYYVSSADSITSGTTTLWGKTPGSAQGTIGVSVLTGSVSGNNTAPGLSVGLDLFRGGFSGSGSFEVSGNPRGFNATAAARTGIPFTATRDTAANKVDGIRLYTSSGTWTTGAFRLIGQKSH